MSEAAPPTLAEIDALLARLDGRRRPHRDRIVIDAADLIRRLLAAHQRLVGLVTATTPIIREIVEAHRDKGSGQYNACDDGPCGWCEGVAALLAWTPDAPAPAPTGDAPMPPLGKGDVCISKFGNRWTVEIVEGPYMQLRNRAPEAPESHGTVYSGELPEWVQHIEYATGQRWTREPGTRGGGQ